MDKNERKERRQKVKELYEQGYTYKEISEKLNNIPIETITNDITYLKKNKLVTTNTIDIRMRKRLQDIKELYEQRKTHRQIAKILGISEPTVQKYINYLREKKLTKITEDQQSQRKKEELEDRRKTAIELLEQGSKIEEISKVLKKSVSTIASDIFIKKKSFEEIEILKKDISKFKEKIENGTLNNEEIEIIKKVATETKEYKYIIYYLKVCIRQGKIEEGMMFVDTQITNENLTEEQLNNIIEMRKDIKKMNQKAIAIRLLKAGRGIEEAIAYSQLSENEVMALNKEIIAKREKNSEEDGLKR